MQSHTGSQSYRSASAPESSKSLYMIFTYYHKHPSRIELRVIRQRTAGSHRLLLSACRSVIREALVFLLDKNCTLMQSRPKWKGLRSFKVLCGGTGEHVDSGSLWGAGERVNSGSLWGAGGEISPGQMQGALGASRFGH